VNDRLKSLLSASASPSVEAGDSAEDIAVAVNRSRDVVLARKVLWAGTSALRRRGLLGRDSIDADEGVYLVPCQWIHMFGMRFPIDVAFLDSRGRVLAIHHGLRPNRFSRPVLRAEGVLELASGRLHDTGTRVGDIIELQ
jgi:uncharacterized membrane protein (UPF0127 family)